MAKSVIKGDMGAKTESEICLDHFTNQIKFWGNPEPSYAFVAEPQTNGVAERFNRTLTRNRIIHGRIYRMTSRTLRDARSATSSNVGIQIRTRLLIDRKESVIA